MIHVSFAMTSEAFADCSKTETRRFWKSTHARKFMPGVIFMGITKDFRAGGVRMHPARVVFCHEEPLRHMDADSFHREGGFRYWKTKAEYVEMMGGPDKTPWVLRFEHLPNQIFGSKSASPPGTHHGKGNGPETPPKASKAVIPSLLATFSLKGWQRERVQRLARICRCIDRGRAQGKTIHKMLVKHAWRWKDRHYKCDPSRRIRFGHKTLLRHYYRWLNGGRVPAAVALNLHGPEVRVTTARALKLARLLLKSQTLTFSAGYRQLRLPRATEAAHRKLFDSRLKGHFAALLAARRRVASLQLRATRTLARFGARKAGEL
jgi:hypothetical protein